MKFCMVARDDQPNHFRLLETSLSLARKQLIEQATLLKDAQSRVELLVGVHHQFSSVETKESRLKPPGPEHAHAHRTMPTDDESVVDGETSPFGASVAELRGLLRMAVRTRLGQQLEIEAMREALSKERTTNEARDAQHRRFLVEMEQSRALHAQTEAHLAQLQEEHATLTAQTSHRIRELEEQVAAMQQDKEREKQLQAALAAAEPEPAMPVASIFVAPARAPPQVMSGMMEL